MSALPPYLIDLRIVSSDRSPVHLWLPLFLLWPFLLVIAVLSLVFTILTDLVLYLVNSRYHSYTLFLVGCLGMLAQTRGTTVRIDAPGSLVDLTVK
jgi:hypothetical protein